MWKTYTYFLNHLSIFYVWTGTTIKCGNENIHDQSIPLLLCKLHNIIYSVHNITYIKKLKILWKLQEIMCLWIGGLVAQAVRRSPPTAGVPSSCLGHSMWVSWWTKRGLGRFSWGFSRFPLLQISFHHFSTLISSISFHFISPCDGASGVIGRHPCYSRTYNIGASSHLIPRPDLVLDTSWGYLMYLWTLSFLTVLLNKLFSYGFVLLI